MNSPLKPQRKPSCPQFSSGPCRKRPGWSAVKISETALVGRSHRSKEAKNQLREVSRLIKDILKIPESYKVGITPASNTGAFELALWSFLGTEPVDVFVWESFGAGWANDIVNQLKIKDYRLIKSNYGLLPKMKASSRRTDICFTWNGTTSGVRVPNAKWIEKDRIGLAICDATSAVFSQELDWSKLDITTFSWQKSMGGEGAHGVLILSPKAVERLEKSKIDRAIPKIFRLTKEGKLIDSIFSGETINTPSMLCVADALDSLNWIEEIGGLASTIARSDKNFMALQNWVDSEDWVENICREKSHRSNTSVCLKIVDPLFLGIPENKKRAFVLEMVDLLENEGVAYDIAGHRDAPPGLRIWCGPTVECFDVEALLPWLTWSFGIVSARFLGQ